jgi:hypothetical protein
LVKKEFVAAAFFAADDVASMAAVTQINSTE